MRFLKSVFYIILAISAYYAVNNFQEVSANISRAVDIVVPKFVNIMTVASTRIHDYCTHDFARDAAKCFSSISKTTKAVLQVLTPMGKSFGDNIVLVVVSVHENAMSYTEDGLNQILGVEGKHHTSRMLVLNNNILFPIH